MSVIFESVIKVNSLGYGWFIKLTDTVDGRVANCESLEDLEKKMQEFGYDYDHDVEVKWSADENVPPEVINEIRLGLDKYKEEEIK